MGLKDHIDIRILHPPCLGPYNQMVGSVCLCGLWGPYELVVFMLEVPIFFFVPEAAVYAKGGFG